MLRKLLFLVLGLPLGIVLVVLSVANRAPVTLVLDPFTGDAATAAYTVSVPLYLLILGTLTLGVILGGVTSWLTTGRWHRTAKRARAHIHQLQAEIERLRGGGASAPPAEAVPALPRPRRNAT
ncbi:lipopolysaccharide assembly protein LapA domain-containing protein [Blastochloris sulfoviridis]|uniref:lipopolysaccharide assembly protein LapA domain-containing protein n=1 Tax=Blastochloris sulfoviridis TaxID=50712 RepID=UPI001478D6A5|nr:lipopolysaccharide assembly protein LapA domain-containing protein [Blastochloris sulfoviridis]